MQGNLTVTLTGNISDSQAEPGRKKLAMTMVAKGDNFWHGQTVDWDHLTPEDANDIMGRAAGGGLVPGTTTTDYQGFLFIQQSIAKFHTAMLRKGIEHGEKHGHDIGKFKEHADK